MAGNRSSVRVDDGGIFRQIRQHQHWPTSRGVGGGHTSTVWGVCVCVLWLLKEEKGMCGWKQTVNNAVVGSNVFKTPRGDHQDFGGG